jgi:hypothetical protein
MKNSLFMLLAVVLLSSCRSAQWHFEKFKQKGGKIEAVERIVTVHDTIPGKDGKDSIIERQIIVKDTLIQYRTKWQTRFDNRRFADSMKHIRKMYWESLDHELKLMRDYNKKEIKINNQNTTKEAKIQKSKSKEKSRSWKDLILIYLLGLVSGILACVFFVRWLYR